MRGETRIAAHESKARGWFNGIQGKKERKTGTPESMTTNQTPNLTLGGEQNEASIYYHVLVIVSLEKKKKKKKKKKKRGKGKGKPSKTRKEGRNPSNSPGFNSNSKKQRDWRERERERERERALLRSIY
ncbi:hypothetical protein K504DRAFT_450617 [Pleomassaria siparia CBS 279.74]|uniref:Uncharacterized protein n=1 Tax=Pleomassaria siparia CBS 279.74 TaxID=1314801 RepID=A0A6G1KME6_9PLEO|nr:hypothetical protein K504DRAFT_450617 [Pleomassaria siparia CBS 279.74]